MEISPIKRKVQVSSNSESESDIVQLDIGGIIFRTSKSTLRNHDGYFRAMFEDHCIEYTQRDPIFIDRDPHTFGSILSFMRTGRIFFTAADETIYLQQLLLEADFYQLDDLATQIREELEVREAHLPKKDSGTQQKLVGVSEVYLYLDQGWKYVGSFEGNETTACSANGTYVEALWRQSCCTACGEQMIYEKFQRHTTSFRPTKVIIFKDTLGDLSVGKQRLQQTRVREGDGIDATGPQNGSVLLSPLGDGAFDQSFG